MFIIYTILAIILSSIIEAGRIKLTYGKTQNVNKVVSFTIGASLFGVCLALIYGGDYYYTPDFFEILIYSIFYASVRGILYDPILNLLRGKEIDYTSLTTNSLTDFIERVGFNWDFWNERLIYTLVALCSGLLYHILY
jgi:hypothetical protein